jgi:hypothetical protein
VCARCVEQGFCHLTRDLVLNAFLMSRDSHPVVSQEKPEGGEYIFRSQRGGGLIVFKGKVWIDFQFG